MKILTRLIVALVAPLASLPVVANEQLAQKYACIGCHQVDKKAVGPSWMSIRDKYKDGSTTAAQLATTIKKGSSGKWGAIPMPPQAAVPDAETLALSTWILQLK